MKEISNKIRALVIENEFSQTFTELERHFHDNPKALNVTAIVHSRYNDWHTKKNIIGITDDDMELNKIRHAILEMLEWIEKQNDNIKISTLIENSNELQEIINDANNTETKKAMDEIKKILAEYIPELKDLSEHFQNKVFQEVRDENIFNINPKRVFVFGKSNAGKTTTINSLLNADVFPTSMELGCTQSLACGKHKGGLIFYDSPGIGDLDKEENITRAALGISQTDDANTSVIKLIDFSGNQLEGGNAFRLLSYNEIAKDINEEFYKNNQKNIIAKEFSVESFQEWSKDKYDFYVYVLSVGNGNGLDGQQLKFLKKLYSTKGSKLKLFKVMNIWNDKIHSNYKPSIDDLNNDTKVVIKQAIQRLSDEGIPNSDEWYFIESNFGNGLQTLVQGFADTLPIEDLVRIEQVVKSDYTHLIQNKIDKFFMDYVAKVASVIAVYPVDHSVQGHNLLSYSVNSIFVFAEYIYGSKKIIPSTQIDSILKKLKNAREDYKIKIKKIEVIKERDLRSGRPVADFINHKLLGNPEKEYYTDTEDKKKKKWYYQVGGQPSVEIILAIGITIKKIHRTHLSSQDITVQFANIYSESLIDVRKQIKPLNIPESLRKFKNRNLRSNQSIQVYSLIKNIT